MQISASIDQRLYGRVFAVAFIAAVVTVVGVAIAPLATFVLMISAFGLPHVIYELRYCDERFSARTSRPLLAAMGVLVGVIALGRIANGAQWWTGEWFATLELLLGATLAAVAAYAMRSYGWLGFVVGLIFAAGATFYPIATFVVWAWVHNLTPLGFVAEITEGEERKRWLVGLSFPFLVLPLLVASGAFHEIADALVSQGDWQWVSMFGAGDKPLLSFLPPGSYDLHLFSAAVVAQSMHYVAVIVLLPALLQAKQGRGADYSVVRWPSWRMFAAMVAGASILGFGIYAVSYSDARAAYSVAAAIHSWIELPILLLALGQGFSAAHK